MPRRKEQITLTPNDIRVIKSALNHAIVERDGYVEAYSGRGPEAARARALMANYEALHVKLFGEPSHFEQDKQADREANKVSIFDEKRYVHGKKSRIRSDSWSASAFSWVFERVVEGRVPRTVEFWHEGRCGRCARALTDPASIRSGFGPECVKHVLRHPMMLGEL